MEALERRLMEFPEAEWNSRPRDAASLLSAIVAEIDLRARKDPDAVVMGLRLLGKLAGCGPDIQKMCVVEVFSVHVVVLNMMRQFQTNATIQKAGCFAIMKIALTKENQALLASSRVRAHETIVQALVTFHDDAGVQEMALRALWNIGVNPANKETYINTKLYIPVLESMRNHNRDVNIQTAGAGVLRAVSADINNQNLLFSQDVRAYDAIITALLAFPRDQNLVETAMAVLCNLCECTANNSAKRKFLLAKPWYAHTVVLAAMRNHPTNDRVNFLCMHTLENLAGFEGQDEDLKGMLVADPHRSADAIIMAMRENRANPAVIAQGFRTIGVLWAGIKRERTLVQLLASPYLLQEVLAGSLRLHKDHETVITSVCRLVTKLVEDKDARAAITTIPINLHISIANIVINNQSSPKIQQYGFLALASMTTSADTATRNHVFKSLIAPPLQFHEFMISRVQQLHYDELTSKANQGSIELLANMSDATEFRELLNLSDFIFSVATWKRESRRHNDQASYEPAKRLLRNLDYYNAFNKVNRLVGTGGYGNV